MQDKPFFLIAAEDDPDDREILQLVFKSHFPDWKYNILHNGHVLLTYLANLPESSPDISLILLDMNMPVKNGIETLEELRANPKYKHIPIVGFSTAYDKQTIEKFLKAGGTLYLQKPDTIDDIEAIIHKLPEIANSKF